MTKYLEVQEPYLNLIRIGNAFSSNYIEYESNGDTDKMLSPEEYLVKIRTCLSNMINNLKSLGEWKIQLTMTIIFISSIDSNGSTF